MGYLVAKKKSIDTDENAIRKAWSEDGSRFFR